MGLLHYSLNCNVFIVQFENLKMRASEIAQQVKVPTTSHEDKCFRARIHMMGEENQLFHVILWPVPYICTYKINQLM